MTRQWYTKGTTNHWTIALISQDLKIMLKILHTRLQHYVNQELTDVQAEFRKERGARDQTANMHWVIEKAREFQKKKKKNIYLCFINYPKTFDSIDHDKL